MAVRVWGAGSNGGSDNDWNNSANWSSDTLPGTGDTVEFDGAISNNDILTPPSVAVSLNTLTVKNTYTGSINFGTYILTITSVIDFNFSGSSFSHAGIVSANEASSIDVVGNASATPNIEIGGSIKNGTVNVNDIVNDNANIFSLNIECREENEINITDSNLARANTTLENTLLENSTTGSEQLSWNGGDNWLGQTFTLASAQKIGAVALKGWDLPGNQDNRSKFKLEIYATSGGLPTGAALGESEDYIINETVPVSSTYDIWLPLKNLLSLSAGTYAFVLRPLSTFNGLVNVGVNNSNPYAGGTYVSSSDGGSSWSATSGRDMRFRIFYISLTDINIDNSTFANNGGSLIARNISFLNTCYLGNPSYMGGLNISLIAMDSIKTNGGTLTYYTRPDGSSDESITNEYSARKIEKLTSGYSYPNPDVPDVNSKIILNSLFNILPVLYGTIVFNGSSYYPQRRLFFNHPVPTTYAYTFATSYLSTDILYGTSYIDNFNDFTFKNRRTGGGF